MEFWLFLIAFGSVCILAMRSVSIADKLKDEINFEGSSLELHYKIQEQIFTNDDGNLPLNTKRSVLLYQKCLKNIRLTFALILSVVILFFIFS